MEEDMTKEAINEIKTVRVWIGNDYIEFEEEKTAEMSEEDFFYQVTNYVMSNISIEVV